MRPVNLVIKNSFFFDENIISICQVLCNLHIVTHFAFKAHICY